MTNTASNGMKKTYVWIGIGIVIIIGLAIFWKKSGDDLSAFIGDSSVTTSSPEGLIEQQATPSVQVSISSSNLTSTSPSPSTKAQTTAVPTLKPKTVTTSTASPISAGGSNSGASGGSGTGSGSGDTTSGSKEVVGANNALSVKGTGTVFKLVTNGIPGLTVTFSSSVTAEVSMTNMSFIINITNAPTLPLTFSFITKAGSEYFVFKNETSRYSLIKVPASGIMEQTTSSAPVKFVFAAGFEPGTWNKNTPDPVGVTAQRPPKSIEASIPGMMYWSYDLGKKYLATNGTFSGVCNSRELRPSVYIAQSDGKEYRCNESASAFAASVKLPTSGLYVCVDSVGNKIGGTADIGSATSCK